MFLLRLNFTLTYYWQSKIHRDNLCKQKVSIFFHLVREQKVEIIILELKMDVEILQFITKFKDNLILVKS